MDNDKRKEWKNLAALAGLFAVFYVLPIECARFSGSRRQAPAPVLPDDAV